MVYPILIQFLITLAKNANKSYDYDFMKVISNNLLLSLKIDKITVSDRRSTIYQNTEVQSKEKQGVA